MAGSQLERWITVNKIRTRYLEASPSNQKCVLFIHGLGSLAERWLDIPLALSLYYRTIAVDLPGFGMSDKPSPPDMHYTIEEYAQFIQQLIQGLRLADGSTNIVGHSLGGYIAAEVAIRYKRLVDRLVLVDSSGTLGGPTPLLRQYFEVAMNPTRESVRRVFENLVADPVRIPDLLVDAFIYRISLPGSKNAFKLAYENSVNTRIGKERLRQLDGIKTLIIWGKQDKLIPLSYCSEFETTITGSRVEVIEDAGHAPFAEKPALACELIRRFLA